MANSNEKGGRFERKICKELSLWLTNGEQEDVFWRSSMSGGRATVALKQDKKLASAAGDISAIHAKGHGFMERYFVELKHYKSLDLHRVPLGSGGNLLDFWDKCRVESANYGKYPILIGKQNFYPDLILLSTAVLKIGKKSLRNTRKLEVQCTVPGKDLHILDYKYFLEHIDPERFTV